MGDLTDRWAAPWADFPATTTEGSTRGSFVVKDSGKRAEFSSGMVRDVADNKTDYSLTLDGPMFERWTVHLMKGAVKYAKRNWMKATGQEELDRFKESAFRHFMQWYRGETDEDHAAAVYFNINGAEYVKGKTAGFINDSDPGDEQPWGV